MLSRADYEALGYDAVPPEAFARYEARAAAIVNLETFGRVTEFCLTPQNSRGICEVIDLLYQDETPDAAPRVLAGFSITGYSESYAAPETAPVTERILAVVRIFFTDEQLYRGV
jgi:hypothetical protein